MNQANNAAVIDLSVLPEVNDAVQEMESLGSRLNRFSGFGIDPLQGQNNLVTQRELLFRQRYPDFRPFFHTVVNNNCELFQQGLLFFIQITMELS